MRIVMALVLLASVLTVVAIGDGDGFETFQRRDREQFRQFLSPRPEPTPVGRETETVAPIENAPVESSPVPDTTPGIQAALNDGASFFASRIQAGDAEPVAVEATVAYMAKLPGVRETGAAEDGCSIRLECAVGTSGMFIFKPMEKSDAGSEQASEVSPEPVADTSDRAGNAPVTGSAPKRAIILEPFENTTGGGSLPDGSPEQISQTLRDAGIEVTHVRGEDAGIQQFSQLGAYDIVYMHTHCGWTKGNTWMSGEAVTPEKTEAYRKQYGDAVIIGKTSDGEMTYTITADFIRKIDPFKGTLVYISGCNSATATEQQKSIAAALEERGAAAHIGYDGYMLAKYATANTDVDFFKYLVLHGLSVDEARAKNPSVHYGKAHPVEKVFKGRVRSAGKGTTTVELAKDKRIEILKAEHRRLQAELVALSEKIQAAWSIGSSSSVSEWEARMTAIRAQQKDIYQRVLALNK